MIQDAKRRGEWVEMQFMARAAAHDLIVAKPWGESARYDVAVDNGAAFYRVQVKSTTFWNTTSYRCHIASRGSKGAGCYRLGEIDFIAAYLIPEDIWFLLPFATLKTGMYIVNLNPHCRTHRYARYMEAWDLLAAKP